MDPEGESPREGDLDPKKMVQRFPSPVNINRTAIFPSDPQGCSTLPLKAGTAYQRTLLLIFLFRYPYIWIERRDAPDLFESSSCVNACLLEFSLNEPLFRDIHECGNTSFVKRSVHLLEVTVWDGREQFTKRPVRVPLALCGGSVPLL